MFSRCVLPEMTDLTPILLGSFRIDDKVPIEQSQEVYDALLKSEHPDVEFEIVDGVDHLYDKNPAEEMTRMYAFINRILDTQ